MVSILIIVNTKKWWNFFQNIENFRVLSYLKQNVYFEDYSELDAESSQNN